jgi:hypothetical protein
MAFQSSMMPVRLVGALFLAAGCALCQPLWGDLAAGPHRVGFRNTFHFDPSRTWKTTWDYTGNFSPDNYGRPIQINIWYPAKPGSDSKPMAFGDYVNPTAPDGFAALNAMMRRRNRDDAQSAVGREALSQL